MKNTQNLNGRTFDAVNGKIWEPRENKFPRFWYSSYSAEFGIVRQRPDSLTKGECNTARKFRTAVLFQVIANSGEIAYRRIGPSE